MALHSRLSPSAAHRWLRCANSVFLEAKVPNESSRYADEGTCAHELCALELEKKYKGLQDKFYLDRYNAIIGNPLWDEGMIRHVASYTDYIDQIIDINPADIAIEQRVYMPNWMDGTFGTADCIIRFADELHIVDFKYGQGVKVDAWENEQLMLYAAGVLESMPEGGVKDVTVHIVQPRISEKPSSYHLSADALQGWMRQLVKPQAEKILKKEGDFNPDIEACRFCRGKPICPALRDKVFEDAPSDQLAQVATLTIEEVAKAYEGAALIRVWLGSLEEHLKTKLQAGVSVPGFKLVEARGARKITNTELAVQRLLKAGYKEEEFIKTDLRTLTTIEKLLGKKKFADLLNDCVTKVPGQPTMVPVTDPRPEYKPGDMFEDVKGGLVVYA